MRMLKLRRDSSGQALIETALVMPFLMLLLLNVVNFGFFFIVALNLAASPRSGVEYSILGFQTPASLALPQAPTGTTITSSTISYLSQQDLTGAISAPTGATIQVCSSTVGMTTTGISKCVSCTGTSCGAAGTGSPAPDADPESPSFVLNRVDVDYVFSPPIPGTPFGLVLLPLPSCSLSNGSVTCRFHRQVSMREMN
jgi:Flp pilus assembly protein TadG